MTGIAATAIVCANPTCSASLVVPEHRPVQALRTAGWRVAADDGDWVCLCPRCADDEPTS